MWQSAPTRPKTHGSAIRLCYLDGDGVRKNRRYAQKWLTEAAKQGFKEAIHRLSRSNA